MRHHNTNLTRLMVTSLAAAAITATVPAGQSAAASGGSAVTCVTAKNVTAPDQVDRVVVRRRAQAESLVIGRTR